jgi:hypothetical protein
LTPHAAFDTQRLTKDTTRTFRSFKLVTQRLTKEALQALQQPAAVHIHALTL